VPAVLFAILFSYCQEGQGRIPEFFNRGFQAMNVLLKCFKLTIFGSLSTLQLVNGSGTQITQGWILRGGAKGPVPPQELSSKINEIICKFQ